VRRPLTIDLPRQEGTRTETSRFDGHYYSDKAIGPSLIGAALYFNWMTGHHHPDQETSKVILTFLVIGLPSAAAEPDVYLVPASSGAARAYCCSGDRARRCTSYSVIFFSHQLASALLFGAFFMIFLLKRSPEVGKSWYLFLIGMLLGWALISEFPTAAIIVPLGAYYLHVVWRAGAGHRLRSLALPAFGGLIPVVFQLAYNARSFGNPFSLGYANLVDPLYGEAMAQGVMGIQWPNMQVLYYTLLHPSMGLMWSRVLLMAFVGAGFMFRDRRYRAEAIVTGWIIAFYVIMMSGYSMWWGGFALGARHIIPALAFLCIPLAFVPRRLTWLTILLAIVSIGQMTIAAASNVLVPDTMVLRIGAQRFFEYSNIYSYCLKELLDGNLPGIWAFSIWGSRLRACR
jgi:hypothetical protein